MTNTTCTTPEPIHTFAPHASGHLDEIVAMELVRRFGTKRFPGADTAVIKAERLPEGTDGKALRSQGVLCFGHGHDLLDEHGREEWTSTTKLVADMFDLESNPRIAELVAYTTKRDRSAKRDDGPKIAVRWELPDLIKVWHTQPSNSAQTIEWGTFLVRAHLDFDKSRTLKVDVATFFDELVASVLFRMYGQENDPPSYRKDNDTWTLAVCKMLRLYAKPIRKVQEYVGLVCESGAGSFELPELLWMWLASAPTRTVEETGRAMIEAIVKESLEYDRVYNETVITPETLQYQGSPIIFEDRPVRHQIFRSDNPRTARVGWSKHRAQTEEEKRSRAETVKNDIVIIIHPKGNIAIFTNRKSFNGRLTLDVVAGILRRLEACRRTLEIPEQDRIRLCLPGTIKCIPQWHYLVGRESNGEITGESLLNGSTQAAPDTEPSCLSDEDVVAALALGLRLRS